VNSSTDRLRVNVEADGAGVTLQVTGDIDPATAPVLGRRLDEAVVSGFPTIALDLREVQFVDSAGLRVLIRANHEIRRHGRRLCLRSPSPPVQRVLEVTGLDEILEIVP